MLKRWSIGWVKAARLFVAIALGGLATISSSDHTRADAVEEFYRGRTIEILVGAGAGGGYDVNARLVSRHLGRHVPGNPTIVVNNMPGGGGITAANFLYNIAAKNGLVLGTFSNAMLTQPLFGIDSVRFDTTRFSWLGSTSREDGLCIASRASGVRSWDELRQKRLVIGTTAPGTTTHLFPTLLHRLLNVDFRFVTGYTDGSQIVLALERGEVEALCQTWSSLKISHPDWIANGVVQPLVFIGLGANSELAHLPGIMDLARNEEQRGILKIALAPTLAGRPFTAPPQIPPERLEALRKAFSALMRDPAFIEDARKMRVEITPVDGAGVDSLLREIFASPPALVDRVRAIVSGADRK